MCATLFTFPTAASTVQVEPMSSGSENMVSHLRSAANASTEMPTKLQEYQWQPDFSSTEQIPASYGARKQTASNSRWQHQFSRFHQMSPKEMTSLCFQAHSKVQILLFDAPVTKNETSLPLKKSLLRCIYRSRVIEGHKAFTNNQPSFHKVCNLDSRTVQYRKSEVKYLLICLNSRCTSLCTTSLVQKAFLRRG